MNTQCIRKTALIFCLAGLLLAGAGGLWIQSRQRQYILSRDLITALMKTDTRQALTLVNAGADPNTPYMVLPPPSPRQLWDYLLHRTRPRDNGSPTAFHIACGSAWTVENAEPEGFNPPPTELVQAMFKHGANLSGHDREGWTPLFYAIHNNQSSIVATLLNDGADVNVKDKKGDPPLIAACDADPTIAHLLIEHGADVNVRNQGGETPLIRLASFTDPDGIRLLLENRADVNARDTNGNSPLMRAVTVPKTPPANIRLLIEHGANVNAVDHYGNTPLTLAVSTTDTTPGTIRLLLEHGADPNPPSKPAAYILNVAQQNNRTDLAALIRHAPAKK